MVVVVGEILQFGLIGEFPFEHSPNSGVDVLFSLK